MTKNESNGPGSAITNNGTLIIGTETMSLEVVKEWKDANGNELKEHPDQVLVALAYRVYKDDKEYLVIPDEKTRKDARQILSEKNNWRYCWEHLDDGKDWAVVEASISGFESKVSKPELVEEKDSLLKKRYKVTLTNKKNDQADSGSLTVSKKVYGEKDGTADGGDADSSKEFTFAVELEDTGDRFLAYRIRSKDGKEGDLQLIENASHFEVTIKRDESFTIEGLPKETKYTITETGDSREGYGVYINGELKDDGTVTGTIGDELSKVEVAYVNVEQTSVSGKKTWEGEDGHKGGRPNEITVILTAKTSANKEITYQKTVTADENNDWVWTFEGLPKYDEEGKELNYSISELSVPDYTPSYASPSNAMGKYDITNTYTPGETSLTVEKIWIDGDDRDHIRPGSVKVQLYKTVDGVKEAKGDAVVLNTENGWSYTWEKLLVKEGGSPVSYSVEEVDVPEKYQVQVEERGTKFFITNTYTPPETPGPGPGSSSDSGLDPGPRPDPRVDIPDNPTPLAPGPEPGPEILILEEPVPLMSLPRTGDTSLNRHWYVAALLSSLGMLVLLFKKLKDEEE